MLQLLHTVHHLRSKSWHFRYDVYFTTNEGFTANKASFYKEKVLDHNLRAAAVHSIYTFFPITVDTINTCTIKFSNKYYCTSWQAGQVHVLVHCYKYATKQKKKQQKLGGKMLHKINDIEGWTCKRTKTRQGWKYNTTLLTKIKAGPEDYFTSVVYNSQATDME